MKLPRIRLGIRGLMIGIAVFAVLLAGMLKFASRPYPGGWFSSAAYYVHWSDNTMTAVEHGPHDLWYGYYGPLQIVRWPDGSYGVYLHR